MRNSVEIVIFFQVDKIYYEDCQNDGDYCKFHKDIIKITTDLASMEGAEELGKKEWVFNEDTQEWEEIITPPTYISVFEFKQLFRK